MGGGDAEVETSPARQDSCRWAEASRESQVTWRPCEGCSPLSPVSSREAKGGLHGWSSVLLALYTRFDGSK